MRLFTKYNRINLISTIIIFLLSSLTYTFLLRYIFISQVDKDLKIEKNEIITYVKRNNHLPAIIEVRDQYTTYQIINKSSSNNYKIYTRKTFDAFEHEKELSRTIEFNIYAGNAWYLVNVSKSLEGADDLIQTIIFITLTIILLILTVSFFINRVILKKLWSPFYKTLQEIKNFNLNNKEKIHFEATTVNEFSYLNSTLNDALNKAQNDYQSLKEFTENASHELQTPLAVIQSKLDNLIQNEKLSEYEGKDIQSAYEAVQSLKKLNQGLLLLAKIENNQFSEQAEINLKELLQSKINQFKELWKNYEIITHIDLSNKTIIGNTFLTDILLNNLLSNATKHNSEHGSIDIILNYKLQIKNTGSGKPLDEKLLFKRFSKQNVDVASHGLGLSIVQQICLASGYTCTYTFETPHLHIFNINFN